MTLESIRDGHPNLSQMEPLTADAVQQQNGIVQPELQGMGNILAINYLGMQSMGRDSGEAYRVRFEHGTMIWVISESSAGKMQILWTSGPQYSQGGQTFTAREIPGLENSYDKRGIPMPNRQLTNCASIIILSAMLSACASPLSRMTVPSPAEGLTGELVGSHTYYPGRLLLQGITGRALVAYSINPSGVAERVVVIRSDNPEFGAEAVKFVRDWHYNVPSAWSKEGGPEHRFRLQLVFLIKGRPAPKPYPNVPTIPVEGTVH